MNDPALDRARMLLSLRQWDQAERQLRQVLANDPQAAFPHSLMALVLLEKQKLGDATDMARRGIVLDPEEAFGHYVLALVMMRRNRYAEATPPIEEAIRLNPFDPRFFAALGNIRLEQRQWQPALQAADRGLELDPEHDWCVNVRGMALAHLGQRSAAAETMTGALERDPENAFTHANRGWALLHENNPRQAMEHFREALRLNPTMDFAKSGMVEAMKARNPLYRVLLIYFLFMARQSGRMQIIVMVGGYLGFRFLVQVNEEFPGLGPFVLPLIVAYIVFALSTWLAPVLMNLLLRMNRFGRHALSADETRTTNLVGILLVAATVMFVGAYFMTDTWLFGAALFTAMLAIPASSLFTCAYGWPRWVALGLLLATASIGGYEIFRQWEDPRPGYVFDTFYVFCYSVLISSIAMQFLGRAKVKR